MNTPTKARRSPRRGRAWWVLAIFGLITSTISTAIVFHKEREMNRIAATQQGLQVQAAIQRTLDLNLEAVRSLTSLFSASDFVSRAEFKTFASATLKRIPSLQALEWVPRVTHAERAGVEARARAEGLAEFQFTEMGPSGLSPARAHETYFPVLYVEPMAGNELALGFCGMHTARKAGITCAAERRAACASPPIELVQSHDHEYGILLFVPYYQDGTGALHGPAIGFVEGVYRVEVLFNAAQLEREVGVQAFAVFDRTAAALQVVFKSSAVQGVGAVASGPAVSRALFEGMLAAGAFQHEVWFAGRTFTVLLHASPRLGASPALMAGAVCFFGLLCTLLLSVNVYLFQGRTTQVEALAATRLRDLRRTEERLAQATRLESIGQLAGGIAHDFNNLLTVISGGVELALLDRPDDVDLLDIQSASQRAAALTAQLLAFGRGQVMAEMDVDLTILVGGLQPMFGRLLGEQIELRFELSEQIATIRADKGKLEQVVMNLVVNARDAFGGERGQITIQTRNRGAWAQLLVTDNGMGMSPDTIDRIFDPFFTTKAPGEGTGLGLATVFGVVQQSGGQIEVQSALGTGTTFEVSFPAGAASSPTEAPRSCEELVSCDPTGACALLVEDDPLVGQGITRQLQSLGYKVTWVQDAEQAIQRLDEVGTIYSVLLTDLVLPGLTGAELAVRVADEWPEISMTVMTGYVDHARLSSLGPALRDAMLPKPFSRAELARALLLASKRNHS